MWRWFLKCISFRKVLYKNSLFKIILTGVLYTVYSAQVYFFHSIWPSLLASQLFLHSNCIFWSFLLMLCVCFSILLIFVKQTRTDDFIFILTWILLKLKFIFIMTLVIWSFWIQHSYVKNAIKMLLKNTNCSVFLNLVASLMRNYYPKRPSVALLQTLSTIFNVPVGFITPTSNFG